MKQTSLYFAYRLLLVLFQQGYPALCHAWKRWTGRPWPTWLPSAYQFQRFVDKGHWDRYIALVLAVGGIIWLSVAGYLYCQAFYFQ